MHTPTATFDKITRRYRSLLKKFPERQIPMAHSPACAALVSNPSFPEALATDAILSFLVPHPPLMSLISDPIPDQQRSYFTHMRDVLSNWISEAEAHITQLRILRPVAGSFEPIDMQRSTRQRIASRRRARLLSEELSEIEQVLNAQRLVLACEDRDLLRALHSLCDWLAGHPMAFSLNIRLPGIDSRLFYSHNRELRQSNSLRIALANELLFFSRLPRQLFGHRELDRAFVRKLVDTAIGQRIAETAYFEPLAGEGSLHLFLESEDSPFRRIPELSGDFAEDGLKLFVGTGAAVLSQFEGSPQSNDREAVLSIMLTRYVFSHRYPEFTFRAEPDQNFSDNLRAIGQTTHNLGFRSAAYRDKEIADVFGPCKDAIDWIQKLQFQLAPVDAAFAIFKAHEALAVVATGAAPAAAHERLPGFDDIFGLWAALLIASGVPDPRGIVDFVNKWAALPGFPKRFIACCAYMEAALAQIEALGQ
jgi:hypothetical protein